MRDLYAVALAKTIADLFAQGKKDPSADEIAEAHFHMDLRYLGGEVVDGIRKRLCKVRDILEYEFGFPVYLVNYTYYSRYRELPPQRVEEARRCLPGGQSFITINKENKIVRTSFNSRTSAGIRLNDGQGDFIYQAALDWQLKSAAKKGGKLKGRTVKAVKENRLSTKDAASMLDEAQKNFDTESLEAEREVEEVLKEEATTTEPPLFPDT